MQNCCCLDLGMDAWVLATPLLLNPQLLFRIINCIQYYGILYSIQPGGCTYLLKDTASTLGLSLSDWDELQVCGKDYDVTLIQMCAYSKHKCFLSLQWCNWLSKLKQSNFIYKILLLALHTDLYNVLYALAVSFNSYRIWHSCNKQITCVVSERKKCDGN